MRAKKNKKRGETKVREKQKSKGTKVAEKNKRQADTKSMWNTSHRETKDKEILDLKRNNSYRGKYTEKLETRGVRGNSPGTLYRWIASQRIGICNK